MKYTGIVINSNVYKDNDLIVDLLTENEIVTFRSKGIKKQEAKNRSLIFDFAFIEAEFYKKGEKFSPFTYSNYRNILFLCIQLYQPIHLQFLLIDYILLFYQFLIKSLF